MDSQHELRLLHSKEGFTPYMKEFLQPFDSKLLYEFISFDQSLVNYLGLSSGKSEGEINFVFDSDISDDFTFKFGIHALIFADYNIDMHNSSSLMQLFHAFEDDETINAITFSKQFMRNVPDSNVNNSMRVTFKDILEKLSQHFPIFIQNDYCVNYSREGRSFGKLQIFAPDIGNNYFVVERKISTDINANNHNRATYLYSPFFFHRSEILKEVIKEYLGDESVFPYDISERKIKYPKAFEELKRHIEVLDYWKDESLQNLAFII